MTLLSSYPTANTFSCDGVQTIWNFSFSGGYISKEHVKLVYTSVGGVKTFVPVSLDMFVGSYTLNVTPAPAAGGTLTIYRETPRTVPLVDFEDGARISEASLDIVAKQSVFIAAETADAMFVPIPLDGARVVNVKDYGAIGNGVADDTFAIQAAINSGAKVICFLEGTYLVSASLIISTNGVSLLGFGKSSRIVTALDIDIIRVIIGGRYAYFNNFTDLAIEYIGAAAPVSGSAIRYYDSTGTQMGGGTHGGFYNLWMNHKYGICFDRAKLGTFSPGFPDVADYGHFTFSGNQIPYNAGRVAVGILFKGGPGAHNRFSGNDFSCTVDCVKMGGFDDGVGDQTFVNNHFLDSERAIDIEGPTTGGRYNQNITITGNQFDGITVNTVRLTRMRNFRVIPNNSTSSVGLALVSCTGVYLAEDRGNIAFTGVFTQLAGVSTSSSPIITDNNGWRYGSDVVARRTTNTDRLVFAGGNTFGAGASVQLFGGAHASSPSYAVIDAGRFQVRKQDGSSKLLEIETATGLMGWFGAPAVAQPTGVPVTAAGIHAALLSLGIFG